MNTETERAGLVPMSNETRGKAIEERMFALSLDESKLSRSSGKSRSAIRSAIAGTASARTYGQLETWLDREERKRASMSEVSALNGDGPTEGHHEAKEPIVVRMEEGGTVVVQGPVEDIEEVRRLAIDLMREWRKSPTEE